ncbi:MAG: alpha-ketoacid dehydrogenase subunit beta [Deltaproteobacteria bacterium HGW-Deltaproteobacteria-13]|jgi:pyruvate dehydrogenase E1 component beta subunit|nr:MAG: alpha-ketoacid dehydrogenase subunit beta [Deltaproteobacteria bacterium HGW-Deltaproteobacteria-13]
MTWSKTKQKIIEPAFSNNEGAEGKRILCYDEAIREALQLALSRDKRVFVMGQGVDDPDGMFGATRNLHLEFGPERVFDTPLAEGAMMGVAIGAALAGMRPVYFHNRPDFLLLAMDQLVNHAAKWSYMFGGAAFVPLVVWACIGRGWGSAAQHSQALQGLFMHIPGLKLVMPGTCHDAKGLMLAAIADQNPVLILDHRFNFNYKGMVPPEAYTVPIGKGVIRRKGRDVTIVAVSHLVIDACHAAQEAAAYGVEAEVIDPRTLRPLDEEIILNSVAKTGRLIIADCGWKTGGITAEIGAMVAEKGFTYLKAPIKRIACPDLPTPAACNLDEACSIGRDNIKKALLELTR